MVEVLRWSAGSDTPRKVFQSSCGASPSSTLHLTASHMSLEPEALHCWGNGSSSCWLLWRRDSSLNPATWRTSFASPPGRRSVNHINEKVAIIYTTVIYLLATKYRLVMSAGVLNGLVRRNSLYHSRKTLPTPISSSGGPTTPSRMI